MRLQNPSPNHLYYFIKFYFTLIWLRQKLIIQFLKLLQKRFLYLSGGSSVGDMMGRIMVKILSEELAIKFSLCGMKGNHNFSTTKVYGTMKSMYATDKHTSRQVYRIINYFIYFQASFYLARTWMVTKKKLRKQSKDGLSTHLTV